MELIRIRKPYLAMLLAASACFRPGSGSAATLKTVWNIDVAKALDSLGVAHTRSLPVLALRFSADGQKLAAIVDWYGPKGGERSRLMVLDVLRPGSKPRSFEIAAGVNEDEELASNFGWSASGDLINAGGTLIRVSDGSHCNLPPRAVLLGGSLAIAPDSSPWNWDALATKLEFFSTACQPVQVWEVQGRWAIADVYPDSGLLSVAKIVGFPNKAEDLIVDAFARKIVRQWSGPRQPGGQFADSGRAVCTGSDVEAAERAPVACWDVDSGERINEAPTINGGDPIAPALHASRIAASSYQRRKMPFSSEYTEVFDRRVLWDFRTGKELLSWRPQFQAWDFPLYLDASRPPKHVNEPFRFAISPDGEYIAEGGNGSLRLYRLAPGPGNAEHRPEATGR
jgi:hypothetical protein